MKAMGRAITGLLQFEQGDLHLSSFAFLLCPLQQYLFDSVPLGHYPFNT